MRDALGKELFIDDIVYTLGESGEIVEAKANLGDGTATTFFTDDEELDRFSGETLLKEGLNILLLDQEVFFFAESGFIVKGRLENIEVVDKFKRVHTPKGVFFAHTNDASVKS